MSLDIPAATSQASSRLKQALKGDLLIFHAKDHHPGGPRSRSKETHDEPPTPCLLSPLPSRFCGCSRQRAGPPSWAPQAWQETNQCVGKAGRGLLEPASSACCGRLCSPGKMRLSCAAAACTCTMRLKVRRSPKGMQRRPAHQQAWHTHARAACLSPSTTPSFIRIIILLSGTCTTTSCSTGPRRKRRKLALLAVTSVLVAASSGGAPGSLSAATRPVGWLRVTRCHRRLVLWAAICS